MKTIKRISNFELLISCLLLFSSCKKENKILENPNRIGTVFGSGGDQELNGVIQTADKNYVLWGTTNAGKNGGMDGFVMKVDQNFNTLWYKNYGGELDETIESLAIDDEGNMMAAGNSNSFEFRDKDSSIYYRRNQCYAVYMDKEGEMIWDTAISASNDKRSNYSYGHKVKFLQNKTFCIAATTTAFLTSIKVAVNTEDVFTFCLNKQSKILWTGRFYNVELIDSTVNKYSSEHCSGLVQADDGTLIFQVLSHAASAQNGFVSNFLKIPQTGPTKFENGWIWKGIITNNPANETDDAMEKISGDRIVIYDYLLDGLSYFNTNGNLIKNVPFKRNLYISDISQKDDKLIMVKSPDPVNVSIGNYGWVICDLEGKIISEHDIILNNIEIKKVIVSGNNEVLAFGTLSKPTGKDIVMLRYNQQGNLIE